MIRTETVIKCGHCGHELDRRPVEGFCSMLGPPAAICPKCKRAATTDRTEWAEMNAPGKAWYLFASLVYVAALAMYGATSGWCVLYFWSDALGKTLSNGPAAALPGAILWSMAGAIIQVLRVRRSLARTRVGAGPASLSRWNLEMDLQSRIMAALFAIPLAAWVLSLPVKWVLDP